MALTSLRPQAVELVANAEDVTEENLAQYVLHQVGAREMVDVKSDNPLREDTISTWDLI
jgi:hypothetical protein